MSQLENSLLKNVGHRQLFIRNSSIEQPLLVCFTLFCIQYILLRVPNPFFQSRATRLYMTLCRSVCRSVVSLLFWLFLPFYCSCPPARDQGSRVYGLVFGQIRIQMIPYSLSPIKDSNPSSFSNRSIILTECNKGTTKTFRIPHSPAKSWCYRAKFQDENTLN